MIRSAGLVLLVLLMAGCASTRTLDPTADVNALAKLNRSINHKVTRVTLADGRQITAIGVQISPDSTSWLDYRNQGVHSVATSEVREVSVMKAGKGALAGAAVGAVTGAALGLVRAAAQDDDPEGDIARATRGEKLATYPFAHAAYVSLVTTPLGGIFGGRVTYQLQTPSAEVAAKQ